MAFKYEPFLVYWIFTANTEDPDMTVNIQYTQSDGTPVKKTLDNETVRQYMLSKYADWYFTYITDDNADYLNPNVYSVFSKMWRDYVTTNQENWNRIALAYGSVYNPIHNYDRTETETTDRTTSNTRTVDNGEQVVTTTPVDYYTETSYPETLTTTNKNTTYDSEALVDTGVTEMTGKEKTDFKYTGDSTVTYGNTVNTITDVGTDKLNDRTLSVQGNIGVMSTQDMINQELKLRNFNFLEYIVDTFAHKYLAYATFEVIR